MGHGTRKREKNAGWRLVMDMSVGLLPKDLNRNAVDLLVEELGDNWFELLGYTEPAYEKPSFEPSGHEEGSA